MNASNPQTSLEPINDLPHDTSSTGELSYSLRLMNSFLSECEFLVNKNISVCSFLYFEDTLLTCIMLFAEKITSSVVRGAMFGKSVHFLLPTFIITPIAVNTTNVVVGKLFKC
jgi:hypothetical protein